MDRKELYLLIVMAKEARKYNDYVLHRLEDENEKMKREEKQ